MSVSPSDGFVKLRSEVNRLLALTSDLNAKFEAIGFLDDFTTWFPPQADSPWTEESGYTGSAHVSETAGTTGNDLPIYNTYTYELEKTAALGLAAIQILDTTTAGDSTNYWTRLKSNIVIDTYAWGFDIKARVCFKKPYGTTYGTQSPSRFVFGLSLDSNTTIPAGESGDYGFWLIYDGSVSNNWICKQRAGVTVIDTDVTSIPVVVNTPTEFGMHDSLWNVLQISVRYYDGIAVIHYFVNGTEVAVQELSNTVIANELSPVFELFNYTGASAGRPGAVRDSNIMAIDYFALQPTEVRTTYDPQFSVYIP